MERLADIEFFKTPDGEVLYRRRGCGLGTLAERDRELVGSLLALIRTRYPDAFRALSELYSRSERNRSWYEFQMASRFVRCNLGNYDTARIDIDVDGVVRFEQMQCPLMGTGDCRWDGVICHPRLDTGLTTREQELLPLLADGLRSEEIAERLCLSKVTVDHHRHNILAKLELRSVTELAAYYHKGMLT